MGEVAILVMVLSLIGAGAFARAAYLTAQVRRLGRVAEPWPAAAFSMDFTELMLLLRDRGVILSQIKGGRVQTIDLTLDPTVDQQAIEVAANRARHPDTQGRAV